MTISEGDVEDRAKAPKRTSTEEGTVQERSVDELIKARNYTEQPSKPPYGMTFARTRPPSSLA